MDDEAKQVEQLAAELKKIAGAMKDGWADDAESLLSEVWTLVDTARLREQRRAMTTAEPVTVSQIVARVLKVLRDGTTQEELAADMRRLGFVTWKRITVAETESGKRRPTWEELLGLALLFGTTITDIISALFTQMESVVLNERMNITPTEYWELVGNNDPTFGVNVGTLSDEVARSVIGVEYPRDDWRPIARERREREARPKGELR